MHAESELSSDELRDKIAQLGALEGVVRSARLAAVAEYDRRELWKEDGSTSMSVWLSALTGCRQYSARELVRVAHALQELPALSGLLSSGGLDWDKVSALTRFVTAETDCEWTDRACSWSAFELEREARRCQRVTEEQDEADFESGSLRCWWARRDRMLMINGMLPAAEGATVLAALRRRAEQQPKDPETGGLAPYERRMATALAELAGACIARDTDPDRATVVVHVSELGLAGDGPGLAELESGVQLRLEAIRRLVCDGRVEFSIDDRFGRSVGIVRASRQIPAWLERQVLLRYPHCEFPGCERTSLLHCHHAIPWLDGGPTNLWNLVPLCAVHHRFLHEKGWRVVPVEGGFRFVTPDGTPYVESRIVIKPKVREWFRKLEAGRRLEPAPARREPHDTS
jgi:hypothetical protein